MKEIVLVLALAGIFGGYAVVAQEAEQAADPTAGLKAVIAEQAKENAALKRAVTDLQGRPEIRSQALTAAIVGGKSEIAPVCKAQKGTWITVFGTVDGKVVRFVGCVGR